VKLHRPAVVVKIDNNAAARPQAGLDAADVVYEEVTEGITRFVVVFQSTDADPIGPVRSVRPADPLIVAPLGGLLVFSGGAPNIVIVQFVQYARFAADAAVTYPEVLSTGEAWYFTNGTLAKGTWSKLGASTVTAYADANGAPMVFPAGRTIVELVHTDANVSI